MLVSTHWFRIVSAKWKLSVSLTRLQKNTWSKFLYKKIYRVSSSLVLSSFSLQRSIEFSFCRRFIEFNFTQVLSSLVVSKFCRVSCYIVLSSLSLSRNLSSLVCHVSIEFGFPEKPIEFVYDIGLIEFHVQRFCRVLFF